MDAEEREFLEEKIKGLESNLQWTKDRLEEEKEKVEMLQATDYEARMAKYKANSIKAQDERDAMKKELQQVKEAKEKEMRMLTLDVERYEASLKRTEDAYKSMFDDKDYVTRTYVENLLKGPDIRGLIYDTVRERDPRQPMESTEDAELEHKIEISEYKEIINDLKKEIRRLM